MAIKHLIDGQTDIEHENSHNAPAVRTPQHLTSMPGFFRLRELYAAAREAEELPALRQRITELEATVRSLGGEV